MKTITIYDPESGLFGPIVSGVDEDLVAYDTYKEGVYDGQSQRVDISTGEVIDMVFVKPVLVHEVRNKRDDILNNYRWTVMPDSPLTDECQADWLSYLKTLQRLLVDYPDGQGVVWPEMPEYVYPE